MRYVCLPRYPRPIPISARFSCTLLFAFSLAASASLQEASGHPAEQALLVGADTPRKKALEPEPISRLPSLTLSAPKLETGQSIHANGLAHLIVKAYRNLGYRIKIEHYPSLRSLAMANQGKVDGELAHIQQVADTFTNLIAVPEPLFELHPVIYALESRNVKRWMDIDPLKLAALRGSQLALFLCQSAIVNWDWCASPALNKPCACCGPDVSTD